LSLLSKEYECIVLRFLKRSNLPRVLGAKPRVSHEGRQPGC